MTPEELDRLEALAQAAPPGPLEIEQHGWFQGGAAHFRVVNEDGAEVCAGLTREEAAHIAACDPTTVLALIERCRMAESRRDLLASKLQTNLDYTELLEAKIDRLYKMVCEGEAP